MDMKRRFIFLFVVIAIVTACSSKEMRVIPLSPYEMITRYTENDTTKEYFFAIQNYEATKQNKDLLDSLVLSKLPKEHLRDNHGIHFFFYEYEKGKIDENFVHKEEPKQENLFMEAEAKLLLEYTWLHGKFMYVKVFKNGRYKEMESRNW